MFKILEENEPLARFIPIIAYKQQHYEYDCYVISLPYVGAYILSNGRESCPVIYYCRMRSRLKWCHHHSAFISWICVSPSSSLVGLMDATLRCDCETLSGSHHVGNPRKSSHNLLLGSVSHTRIKICLSCTSSFHIRDVAYIRCMVQTKLSTERGHRRCDEILASFSKHVVNAHQKSQ